MNSGLAGSVASAAACIVLQPLDVLKTRSQQTLRPQSYASLAKGLYRSEGVMALWKGTVPSILRAVPGAGLYFLLLDGSKAFSIRHGICTRGGKLTKTGDFINGAFARGLAGLAVMPFVVLKTRFESSQFGYASLGKAAGSMLRKEGARSFFKGYGACLLRDIPQGGLFVLFYRNALSLAGEPPPLFRSFGALLAGILTVTITHPFDSLKTRVQLSTSGHSTYAGAVRELWNTNGMYRGWFPRAIKKSLGSAITWALFEALVIKPA